MSRISALFAGFICLWIAISAAAASAIAFEMEGLIDVALPLEAATERNSHSAVFTFPRDELPDRWNCNADAGVERIRDLSFCPVMGSEPAPEVTGSRAIRFRILIEKGLEAEADEFVAGVSRILNAPTGWTKSGVRFTRVHRDYDLTVLLASPASVDRLCRPLQTRSWLSCAIAGRAAINVKRWREGAETWRSDIAGYHHYLINHEVGHLLGMSHASCPAPGEPAPIMLPQTRFLGGCIANGSVTRRDLAMLRRVMPRFARNTSRRRLAEAAKKARADRIFARRSRRVVSTARDSTVPLPTAAPRRLTRLASSSSIATTVPLPVRRQVEPISRPRPAERHAAKNVRTPKRNQFHSIAGRVPKRRTSNTPQRWRGKAMSLGRISKRKARTRPKQRFRRSITSKSRHIRKRHVKSSIRQRRVKRLQRQARRKRWRSKWFKGPQ